MLSHINQKIRKSFIGSHTVGRSLGADKVRFRFSGPLRILLFITGEPQKLDKQKYMSLESSFHKLSKIHLSDSIEVLEKLCRD